MRKSGFSKTYRPTYQTWQDMRQRCSNPKCHNYPNYGARGISVCERWNESFEAFLADMGERPSGMTIDRVDVNGNYEPGNCRWADRATQRRNQRDCVHLTLNGETHTAEEWGRIVGIDPSTIRYRIRKGMSISDAIQHAPFPGMRTSKILNAARKEQP